MEYCLKGKVTFEDFQHYNKSPQKKLFIRKTSIIVNLFFYLSIAILIYINYYYFDNIKYLFITAPLEAFKFYVLPYIIVIILLFYIYKVDKKLFFNLGKYFKHDLNITINEQYIIVEIENSKDIFKNEEVKKIVYDVDSIYIEVRYKAFLIIKKRFLEDENEFEGLIEFIKVNYKNRVEC